MDMRKEIQCPPELGGPSTPWLIYPNAPSMKSHTFCNILEPNKNCLKRIPEMRRKLCRESSHGWLVMLDMSPSDGCSLWNPVSMETIHLPDLKFEDDDDFDLMSCTLSSAPTDPGCMVLFFFYSNPVIIYCQPGDAQWTRQSFEIEDGGIEQAVGFSDGTIYACTPQANTLIIRRDSSGCLSLKLLNVQQPKCPPRTRRIHSFFFESCGELFHMYMSFSGTDAVNCITVFKMDFSQMVWVKTESLGGQVFFLSFNGISFVSCSPDRQSGLEGDCIYFTLPAGGDKGVYVFDMKDDSISVSLPCPDLQGPWCSPFWFISMTNSIVEQTNSDEGRTLAADEKMNVKETAKEILMEDGNVQMGCSVFSSLPKELQYSIATNLTSAVDYMNFRSVCKTWRSVAPPIPWISPWLMVVQKGVSFFLDPECNSIYRMNSPELFDAAIRFSKDGWLLMSKGDLSMFFFDPFTKTKIEVPDMTICCCFEGICFSSLPTSSDCVIFGIGLLSPSSYIVRCYCLGDEDWCYEIMDTSEHEPFSVSRSNPVYYDGAFYCLSHEGRLGVFDVNENWKVLNCQPCSSTSVNFMVECDGELLSVFIDDGGNSTIVSRLDRTMMDWVRVKSLSDRMLFLSSATSIAVETQEKKLQNKVFLPRVWNKKNNDVVFYSLETEKYHSFSSSSSSRNDFYGTKEQLYCSWIQPNLVEEHLMKNSIFFVFMFQVYFYVYLVRNLCTFRNTLKVMKLFIELFSLMYSSI